MNINKLTKNFSFRIKIPKLELLYNFRVGVPLL